MALSKKKTEEKEVINHEIEVTRAKELENVIMFDMKVNDVTIYGCSYRVLTRKDTGEEFGKVGFPSKKSGDNYYNHAFVKLSSADIENIEKQLEKLR
jgi:hypothetical protein